MSQHIDNILTDGELDENLTVKNFLTVRQEGKRQVQRDITYYNLDMIIAKCKAFVHFFYCVCPSVYIH